MKLFNTNAQKSDGIAQIIDFNDISVGEMGLRYRFVRIVREGAG